MTTAIKRRRGTTTQHSTFTGLEGEITIDTTKDTAVVHDGATAGGRPLLREDLANNTEVVTKTGTQTLTNKTLTSPVINTPTGITKSDISLGNVDNTSDATKNAATATLTNKTITLGANTITGTVAQFQAAVTDGDFATLAGTETLTNKAFNGSLGATTPSTIAGTTITSSALTSGRVTFASTGGLLADSANLTFDGTTLSTSAISASGTNAFISNTATGTTGKYIDIANTSGRSQFGVDNSSGTTFLLSGGVAYSTTITSVGANPVIIGVNQAKVATFDTSGNLGLGVTPSAYSAETKAIDIGAYGVSIANTAGYQATYVNNGYYNAGWKYKATGYQSANYTQSSGGHSWHTAPSGTAGTAITFTQAMTLDASGKLGIGVTPSYTLDVVGTASISRTSANTSLYLTASGVANTVLGFNNSGASDFGVINNASYFGNRQAYPIVFITNETERMRLDASGNLLVGTTSASASSGEGIKLLAGASSNNICVVQSGSTSATDAYHLYSTGAGAYRFYVDMGGTVHATSIVISAISDERLKENIKDIDTGLNAVLSLKPRRFDWKDGKGQNKKNAAGFIAQEFAEVFKDSVSTSLAGDDGIEYLTMSHEELIPSLVKAIQELSAKVTALEAQLGAK